MIRRLFALLSDLSWLLRLWQRARGVEWPMYDLNWEGKE